MIQPADLHAKRILISPLNWGMGHVSRCIGVIHQLLEQGNTVFIACDIEQQRIFEEYFDDVIYIEHAGYPFHFGGRGKFGWDLLSRSNALRKRLKEEREEVNEMIEAHQIDVVISDHRYGFVSSKVASIFMTHQLNLPVKWYEKGVDVLHQKLMKSFEFIWVLDDETSSLAGKLSRNCPKNGCYIGHFSRFSMYSDELAKTHDEVLIASGPDVYAQELIRFYVDRMDKNDHLTVVHSTSLRLPENIVEVKGSWRQKDEVIRRAGKILSRSGYSTLMDRAVLGVSGEFIPTKGQAEQEYLADRFKRRTTNS